MISLNISQFCKLLLVGRHNVHLPGTIFARPLCRRICLVNLPPVTVRHPNFWLLSSYAVDTGYTLVLPRSVLAGMTNALVSPDPTVQIAFVYNLYLRASSAFQFPKHKELCLGRARLLVGTALWSKVRVVVVMEDPPPPAGAPPQAGRGARPVRGQSVPG